jgi:hypothetical protein
MSLLVFDDFAPDASKVREALIASEFKTETGPDGLPYTGICTLPVPHWPQLLADKMGHDIECKLSFFRMNVAGELPHTWIHNDDICAKFAAVLYLNTPEQCQGGTAFWRHTILRRHDLPMHDELKAQGIEHPEWFRQMMGNECKSLDYWEQHAFVGMQFNRIAVYPTAAFHSRYPFEGFGTTPADARLVWTAFFDIR